MAELIRMSNAAWKRQPSGLVELNHSNPYVSRLLFAWHPNYLKQPPSYTIEPTRKANELGLGMGSASNSQANQLQFSMNFNVAESSVIIMGHSFPRVLSTAVIINIGFSSTTAKTSITQSSAADWRYSTGAYTTLSERPLFFSRAVYFSGTNYPWNVGYHTKDKLIAEQSGANTSSYGVGDLVIAFAAGFSIVNLIAVFDKYLNSASLLEFYQNPWQLFAPAPSRFILIPSGVAIPSLSSPFFTNRIPRVTLTY